MSKEKRRVPKLRFPGFTEDWEQRKLDDIAKIKTGGGTPKTANPEYWSGNIPWIQSSDLVEGDIVHVNINKFINNNALKNSAAKLISRNSIALVTRVGVGKVAVINQDFTTSQDFLSLSEFDGSDIKFLAYQLYRLMQENAKVLQGTSIKGITKTELIEQNISIPSSGQEQNLISDILSKIDSIITLHQRKLDNLKLKKKALLQKLFPKNGERYPELRFPGFTDAWEQRKLGSIGSTYTGLSGKTKEDFGHGEAQYITYLNVFQNTVSDITMTDKVEIDTTQNEVKYGDVLFTTSSETPEEVGMSSVWLGHMPNIYLNSFCFGFRPNQKIDPYFLGYSLRAPYMRDKIKILAQGISRYNISKNKVMELEISLPNNEEQRLLGNFLRNIDLSITLHQRKLEHLKLQKKALLQQMFV